MTFIPFDGAAFSVTGLWASPVSAPGIAEVSAYAAAERLLFVAGQGGVRVLDAATGAERLTVALPPGAPNSIAVSGDLVAVALEAPTKTDPGSVFIARFSVDASDAVTIDPVATVPVGALPDMLTFTPDGTRILVANEGEPNSYGQADSVDPEGSVSVIELGAFLSSGDPAGITVATAGFDGFNGDRNALIAAGVRIFGPGASVAQDLEPEYITVSPDGSTAFVALQEANALGILDLGTLAFTDIVPLGFKDHGIDGFGLGPSDRDGGFTVGTWPVLGMYQPDGIASFTFKSQGYIVSANEGDARDYAGFAEEVRVGDGDVALDPAVFGTPGEIAALTEDEALGRLTITNGDGTDVGTYAELRAFGGRSIGIWDASGALVWDSGDAIETALATFAPDLLDDGRSDNKGPEPEHVAVGEIDGTTYAFVGLERTLTSSIMVFELGDADGDGSPDGTPVGLISGAPGELAPEVFTFTASGPDGRPTLFVPSETSATVNAFAFDAPANFTLQLLHHADFEGNTNAIGDAPRLAALFDHFDDTYVGNTLKLSGGDNWIPSPWYSSQVAGNGAILDPILQDVYETLLGLPAGSLSGLTTEPGRIDQAILNLIGIQASALGNHEFDQGPAAVETIIGFDATAGGGGFDTAGISNIGSLFPYLSANLDFTGSAALGPLFTDELRDAASYGADAADLTTSAGIEALLAANGGKGIAPWATVEVGGETIGLIGATTQRLASISSPGDVGVIDGPDDDMAALAATLQPFIDAMEAAGINKIVLMSHLQDYQNEVELAGLLAGADIILSAGSDAIFANPSDVIRPGPGVNEPMYPLVHTGADGAPVLQVNTDGQYTYLGRLVVEFDADGEVIVDSLNMDDPAAANYSGAFAATDEVVDALWGGANPYAEGTIGGEVKKLADGVDAIIGVKLANVAGYTDVFLNGLRTGVRNEETNLGNLTADANLFAAEQFAAGNPGTITDAPLVSLKNGGGIRAEIGLPLGVSGPEAPPGGVVSQLDIETALAFNNLLVVVPTTADGLRQLLEHGVANAGTTSGRFPQVGGVAFSYDTSEPAGSRIQSLALLGEDGAPETALVKDGALVVQADIPINVVTLNFLAGDGDGYPFSAVRTGPDVPLATGEGSGFEAVGGEQKALFDYLKAFHPVPEQAYSEADAGRADDTRIQDLAVREDTVLDGIDMPVDAAVLEFGLFQTAVTPGRPETTWLGELDALKYTDAAVDGVQDSSADDDSTGAALARFSAEHGDVAILAAEFDQTRDVRSNTGPVITLDWENGAATLTHELRWNTIKVLTVEDFTGEALTLQGWVDVDLDLASRAEGLSLTVDGSKRGVFLTGGGDDTITLLLDSNGRSWTNDVVVDAGGGDDVVILGAATRAYAEEGAFPISYFDTVVRAEVKLGAGDDTLIGSSNDQDVAVYDAALGDLLIEATADGFRVTDLAGDEGVDLLSDVEFIDAAGERIALADAVTPLTAIAEIQGAGHESPLLGRTVLTTGVVTAIDTTGSAASGQVGFYFQDPDGDGDYATSDAIFVFTGSAPTVSVGDVVQVAGTVEEFKPGGAATNLSITRIVPDAIDVTGTAPLPAAVVLGDGGRLPPTGAIDSDAFTVFNPETDGIDFYETLEAMRVTVRDAAAVSGTNRFGETWAVTDQGANAIGINAAGGITIGPDDFNPERIQLQTDAGIVPGIALSADTGDLLGDVTGVMSYDFGNFELKLTGQPTLTDGGLAPEVTTLTGGAGMLTVATFNILNFSPNSSATQAARLGEQIAVNLAAPDIIALQEVQDNNGTSGGAGSDVVDGDLSGQALIDAILAAGGPLYTYLEVPPEAPNIDGGVPGGNIRTAHLYNDARVDLVGSSLARLADTDGDDAFAETRKPLVAEFAFEGETITLVNNHFASKTGSDPLFGANQPPLNADLDARTEQAAFVRDYVDGLLGADADANVIVLGDLNEFWFLDPLTTLTDGGALTNLHDLLPAEERWTYVFEGNAQTLDHILVSGSLLAGAEVDVVHTNAAFAESAWGSDHDPVVARLTFGDDAPLLLPQAAGGDFAGMAAMAAAASEEAITDLAGAPPVEQFLWA